ncbi:AzlD domain-containing protein [Pseudomonas fulva]|uniref:AzlD domain-containing protein n=1 Tax=Pseudomonas putida group TaxID=136845 RepID=UPI0018A9CC2D|nr:AzlD domain-containing protein [Pseudomonas putida]MBF8726949.1 AzlD domain-containing protein [Pseudomonas putida]
MPEEKYLIGAVALMMAITYFTRATPLLFRMQGTPKVFNDVIEYLPVAIIASITVPALLMAKDGSLMAVNADMLAAVPVLVVAYFTRSLIFSVAAGIAAHVAITLVA